MEFATGEKYLQYLKWHSAFTVGWTILHAVLQFNWHRAAVSISDKLADYRVLLIWHYNEPSVV